MTAPPLDHPPAPLDVATIREAAPCPWWCRAPRGHDLAPTPSGAASRTHRGVLTTYDGEFLGTTVTVLIHQVVDVLPGKGRDAGAPMFDLTVESDGMSLRDLDQMQAILRHVRDVMVAEPHDD